MDSSLSGRSVDDIVGQCLSLVEDHELTATRAWKEAVPGRRVVGYMPVYVPRELIHAAGALPLGLLGGGEALEVIHGDACFQSYICHIPRSTIELAVRGRLDVLDGMLFPSTCDVIRNLSGMWRLMFPGTYVRYLELPQNFRADVGGSFLGGELRRLRRDLAELTGRFPSDADLRASIVLYNENRRWMERLYAYRSEQPWKAPAFEIYLVARSGMVVPVEEHSALIAAYLTAAEARERPPRDHCRVVMQGLFCEQPPLALIKAIERAGCWVVDDDAVLVSRWHRGEVDSSGDPLDALVAAYLETSVETAARYQPDGGRKGEGLLETVRRRRAEGVIFASPSFCDPALLDRPMLAGALERAGVPFMAFKYAENSVQTQSVREQAGTFADSVKLWGEA